MHDPPNDAIKHEVRIVPLSRRDLEDASRLLKLLAAEEDPPPIGTRPAESLAMAPPQQLLSRACEIIANRRRRLELFGKDIVGEPAWEMLLLLYIAEATNRYTVSQLAQLSGSSKSTGARWIDHLEQRQLIEKDQHPTDRRMAFVRLSSKGRSALELYLDGTISTRS